MKKFLTFLAAAFFVNVNAQVCFTSTNYSVNNTNQSAIASADFNSDGKLDLAISGNVSQRGVFLLLGNGLGSFGAPNFISNSLYSAGLISADFNNDGKADLASIENSDPGYLKIMLGNGAGNFAAADSFQVGSYPTSFCAADFNGDGKVDFAVANNSSNYISVLLGNGSGSFATQATFSAITYQSSICSGDFNGDGKADLALASDNNVGGADTLAVFLGNGAGSFATAVTYIAGGNSYSICSKDFNADGYADIAVSHNATSNVSIFLSQGASGLFNGATNYPMATNGQPYSMVAVDFNSDGKTDLAIDDNNNNSISVLLGTSTGSFGSPYKFTAHNGPIGIISADFNNDGKPDLATTNLLDVTVLLNMPAPHVTLSSSNPSSGCASASATLTASGATTYTWSTNTGVSNPNYTVTTAVVTPSVITTYSVMGAQNGCKDSAFVTPNAAAIATPNICMVTTDAASGYNYNIVYWDKTPYTNVDSFIVYRQVSTNYVRIGAVSKNALSEFTDTAFSIGGPNGGNPQYSSWSYKLAIKDTCGNIGAMSPYHATMFLQENNANFSWSAYTVEAGQANPLTGYSFLRDDNNTGAWHVLANIMGTSSTDPNYSSYPNGNWRITATGFNCTPTLRLAGGNNNTQSTYVNSSSNPIKPVAAGISQVKATTQLSIYPNPSNGYFVIQTIPAANQSMQLFNANGKLLLSQTINGSAVIDGSRLAEGVYYISITSNEGVVNKKLVIVK
jgi:hypothetical protein